MSDFLETYMDMVNSFLESVQKREKKQENSGRKESDHVDMESIDETRTPY